MKVLLAFDGSDYALRAAKYLCKLKKENPSTTVTVLVVSEMDEKIEEFLRSSKLYRELQEAYHKQATETMEKAVALFQAEQVEVETAIRQGLPSRNISSLAEEGGYDMIVMGKHGTNEFKGILIGSNTRQVISFSKCPVLVVK